MGMLGDDEEIAAAEMAVILNLQLSSLMGGIYGRERDHKKES